MEGGGVEVRGVRAEGHEAPLHWVVHQLVEKRVVRLHERVDVVGRHRQPTHVQDRRDLLDHLTTNSRQFIAL